MEDMRKVAKFDSVEEFWGWVGREVGNSGLGVEERGREREADAEVAVRVEI
jgi:hypothetical protein